MALKKAVKKKRPEEDEEDDAPDWRQKARQRQNEKSAGDRITLEEGDNCLRVLPDKKDVPNGVPKKRLTHSPYREYRIHYGVGPKEVHLACGHDIEGNGECWLCDDKIPELAASSKKAEVVERISSKEAFLVQACVYSDGKFGPPKPWSVSTGSGIPGRQKDSLAVRLMSKLTGSKKDYLDPRKGYNLNIGRSGTGMKTRYVSIEGDENPTEVPEAILRRMADLDTLVPAYDEDDQKNAYFDRERGRKDEDEDEDTDTEETNDEETEEAEEEAEESDSEESDEESEEADEEDEESDEESEEADEESDDEEAADEEEEEEQPKKKPAAKKAPAKKVLAKKKK